MNARYDTDQPWVTWEFITHENWFPIRNSTRWRGRSRSRWTCCVCGESKTISLRLPRWGDVPEPKGGKHAARVAFLAAHAHPDRGHPMSWVLPLRNPAAHVGGLDLRLLAFRLETDLNTEDSQ